MARQLGAVRQPDAVQAVTPAISPRNHWNILAEAMESLAAGDPRRAWHMLSEVRQSDMIGAEALAQARALVASELKQRNTILMDRPADFLRTQPGAQLPRVLLQLPKTTKVPRNYPADMVLPPLVGNGNDFGFLTETIRYAGLSSRSLPSRMRLVFNLSYSGEIEDLKRLLDAAAVSLRRIPSVDLVVFCPEAVHGYDLGWPTAWATGTPWTHSAVNQLQLLTDGTDVIAFLPKEALADPLLLERALRYNALNDSICLALLPLAVAEGAVPDGHVSTVLNEAKHWEDWRRAPFAFRRLLQPNFVISAKFLSRIRGFSPRFRGAEFATRELAFRAYNAGAFFVPLAVRADWPDTKGSDKVLEEDRNVLIQLCPHPWERKAEGQFEVPKVSIYIPAYRAARYLSEAIDSVLSQDFDDLEICVADDGSPDATSTIMDSYAGETRVRWATALNGGIGHASNRALRMTRGLYIGQLDSDDRLKPGAIRRFAEFLDENSAVGCVYGSCERVDANGSWLQDEYNHLHFSREKMMLTSIAHHFRMFRRQVWMRTEGFREDIVNAVDYDMFLKMSEISRFHHLNEVVYQRRWHGKNTSKINEALQTRNTTVVQQHSLERQGLDAAWEVYTPDAAKPRQVTYRRRGQGKRVFFWPDYSRSNPYQRLLYSPSSREIEFIGAGPDEVLKLLSDENSQKQSSTVFHLHWLNKILQSAKTVGEAANFAKAFIEKLEMMKFCGVRIVWTIHNTVAHDTPFAQVEVELARRIIQLADCVHVHSKCSVAEIERYYHIPEEKLRIARHGAYVDPYPDFVNREQARHELAIAADDEVVLFLGQIRPYKGLNTLISSFRTLLPERPKLRLLIGGGNGLMAPVLEALNLSGEERSRLTVVNRFVDDSELQLFFRSADFTVLPYRDILTSGSLLLALSFGTPVLIPDYAMPAQVLMDGNAGIVYSRTGGEAALQQAMRTMLRQLDDGGGPELAKAARNIARVECWEDITPLLFGDSV